MPRVVCAGHVNWDVTLRVDTLPEPDGETTITDRTQSSGGSAANVAATLAGLDVSTALLGSVGDDDHGHLAEQHLADAGVDCTHLVTADSGKTTVKYLLVNDGGEVTVLGNDGANEAVAPADVDNRVVREADHVHLTSQRPETAAHVASVARDAGVPVSFDPGRRVGEREFAETFEHATLLFLNEREAERVRAAGRLGGTDTIVVKQGAGGASLDRNGESATHPGFPVESVDTTGAGDAFVAGFLAARFDGRDDESALAIGNACGALTARVSGSRTPLSWRDVEALLDIGASEPF